MRTSFSMRAATHAAILAVALTTGSTAAGAMFATDAIAAEANQANIDYAKTDNSIVVHKRLGTALGTHDNGLVNGQAPGVPLSGVTFKLEKVMAITNARDFETAAAMRLENQQQLAQIQQKVGELGETAREVTTNGSGEAAFTNLGVGLYLVTETETPAFNPDGFGGQMLASKPFLVMLPMTNQANQSQWNYNVNVYPKNQFLPNPTKTVDDADKHLGDELTYTIKTPLPDFASQNLQAYRAVEVYDDLDQTKVNTEAGKVTVAIQNGATLDPSDYTVEIVDDNAFAKNAAQPWTDGVRVVKVRLTDSGLTKVADAKKASADSALVTTIKATVYSLGDGEQKGLVKNEAITIVDNGDGNFTPYDPDNPPTSDIVTSKFGTIRLTKHAANDEKNLLSGAKFQVFNCTGDDANPVLSGAALTVNGQNEWTTGSDQANKGVVEIAGLHVSDFINGQQVGADAVRSYCLVETKAPEGYELLTKPIMFNLTGGEGDEAIVETLKVANIASTTPNLPLTGGTGVALAGLAGVTIIGGGALMARRNTKKA